MPGGKVTGGPFKPVFGLSGAVAFRLNPNSRKPPPKIVILRSALCDEGPAVPGGKVTGGPFKPAFGLSGAFQPLDTTRLHPVT